MKSVNKKQYTPYTTAQKLKEERNQQYCEIFYFSKD